MENKIKKLNIEEKVLAFVIAFLAILSCAPVIFSGFNSLLITVFIGLLFLFIFKLFFKGKVFLRRNELIIFTLSFFIFLYIAIPFRQYDRFSPSVIWFFIFSITLLVNKKILIKGFYYFSNIIYIISILALIVLMLNAIGVPLPSKIISREIGGYFTSYFISVKLSGQDYSLMGLKLYRLNGVFAEPGHFGLLLTMVLYAYNRDIFRYKKGKILLLTCILTLSFGSLLLLLGLLIQYIVLQKKYYLLFLSLFIIGSFVLFLPEEVLNRFFLDKADGSIEERTSNFFINTYNNLLNQGDVFFGNGRDVLEIFNVRNSDYRGFLIRYGVFGFLLYLFLFISLYLKKPKTIQCLGFLYFILVFFHRSWFVDYFAFLFFLLILTFNLSYESSKSYK